MTPDQVLERAREIQNSDKSQGSERVLANEVVRLRNVLEVLPDRIAMGLIERWGR